MTHHNQSGGEVVPFGPRQPRRDAMSPLRDDVDVTVQWLKGLVTRVDAFAAERGMTRDEVLVAAIEAMRAREEHNSRIAELLPELARDYDDLIRSLDE